MTICDGIRAHTPGPWIASRDEVEAAPHLNGDFRVADTFGPDAAANANLISAAPDLLAALWSALSAANELELSSAHFPRVEIEAAIAKAECRS